MSTAATCCEYHRTGGEPSAACKRPIESCKPPPDPEIDALERCLRVLLPLDAAARSRVLEYLDDRLQPRVADEGATP